MNRYALIGVAALVGVVAAFFTLGSPDVGTDVAEAPVAAPSHELPAPPPDAPGLDLANRHPELVGSTQSDVAREREARLQQPDAVAVAQLGSAWTGVRFELGKLDDDRAKELSTQAGALSSDYRNARRAMDTTDLDALRARGVALLQAIDAGGYTTGAVAEPIATLDGLYHGASPEPGADAAEGSAPTP
ncbi:MAG: hypothetical protein H6733_15905 [Alphaproteobacteria bacterium]|nr:hypothetical protein [Alphaproteobacteria bacterium]